MSKCAAAGSITDVLMLANAFSDSASSVASGSKYDIVFIPLGCDLLETTTSNELLGDHVLLNFVCSFAHDHQWSITEVSFNIVFG